MSNEDRLARLVAKARQETPPQLDVADRVMVALQLRSAQTAGFDPMLFVAAPAAVAAVGVVLAAFTGGVAWSDLLTAATSNFPWWML